MHNLLILTLSMFISFSVMAEPSPEMIFHNVEEGKWHKSGYLTIGKYETINGEFKATINYKLKPKGLMGGIIKKFLKGAYVFSLPGSMSKEAGYIDLRDNGVIDIANEDKVATLKYIERLDLDFFTGVHKIEIRSKSTVSDDYPDGKWHIFLFYHPSIKSMGIVRVELYYHGKFGTYDIVSNLK